MSPPPRLADMTASLPPLDETSMSRVLVVVAHPDDAEYGLSCAVHRWTSRGIDVDYLLLTHGEAGIRDLAPGECAPLRAQEQRRACEAVGVRDLTILDHPDSRLTDSLELRRDIARHIRKVRPDTLVVANFDLEAYGGFNQADHRVAGRAAVDAVSAADNPWSFPELDAEPWKVDRVLVAGAADPTHVVEIAEEDLAAGVRSLAAHEAYLAALPGHPAPDPFLRGIVGDAGGVAVRLVEM